MCRCIIVAGHLAVHVLIIIVVIIIGILHLMAVVVVAHVSVDIRLIMA